MRWFIKSIFAFPVFGLTHAVWAILGAGIVLLFARDGLSQQRAMFGEIKPLAASPNGEAVENARSSPADDPGVVSAIRTIYDSESDATGNITKLAITTYQLKDQCFLAAKKCLAKLKHVQTLEISHDCGKVFDAFGALPALDELILDCTADAEKINVGTIPSLRKLKIIESIVTDEFLDHVCKLKALDELKIDGAATFRAPERKSDFDIVRHLPNIRSIELDRIPLCDDDVARLKELDKLEDLKIISSPKISNRSVEYVACLPRIKALTLTGAPVTSESLLLLKGTRIETLSLEDTSVDDTVFQYIPQLPNLKRIYLGRTKITRAAALAYVKKNPRPFIDGIPWERPDPPITKERTEPDDPVAVEELKRKPGAWFTLDKAGNVHALLWKDFNGSKRPKFALIRGLHSLQILEARDLIDSDIASIAGHRYLKDLNLSYGHISDAGLVRLESLISLEQLSLESSKELTDAGLKSLAKLANLHSLDLSYTNVRGPGLAHLKGNDRLRVLNLANSKVDNSAMPYLIGLTRLESVSLSFTSVSDESIDSLLVLKNLRELSVFNSNISNAGVKKLKSRIPTLSLYYKD